MVLRFFISAILVLVSDSSLRADLVLIDSFGVGEQSITADKDNSNVSGILSGLDPLQVLDARRQLTIQGAMSSGSITADVETGPGTLTYSSNNPVYTNQFDGTLLIVHVAGNRSSTYDLSAFANHYYQIDVASADLGSAGSTLEAELRISSPTGSATSTFTLLGSETPYTIAIPMSSLTGVDLSKSYNMQMDIGGIPSDATFQLDRVYFNLSAVPESTTLGSTALLLFAAMIGFIFHRQRQLRPMIQACP